MDLARQPWFRRWAGRFLKIFGLEEANLSDFVGGMSCEKKVVIGFHYLMKCGISKEMLKLAEAPWLGA